MKISEIASLCGGELFGDGASEITSASDINSAVAGQIAFSEAPEFPSGSQATCILINKTVDIDPLSLEQNCSVIKVERPKLAFARIAALLHPQAVNNSGIHPTAIIAASAEVKAKLVGAFVRIGENSKIGSDCVIHDGVIIGDDVSLGDNSVIYPNCVIYSGNSIGRSCILHAGVVVGADGFGYVKDESGEYVKFPQIGRVVIEDNVEIGANTCIDRAALGETRIGAGTKIDNMVQVAHNVRIGKRCVIAALTGISGSVVIEDDCVIGGQVGFGDHVLVKSGAVIGSQAGVLPGKIVRPGVWWGTPIQPLDEFKRQNAHVKGIARLKEEVKEIKRSLSVQKDENS